jgi:hypothetical protein
MQLTVGPELASSGPVQAGHKALRQKPHIITGRLRSSIGACEQACGVHAWESTDTCSNYPKCDAKLWPVSIHTNPALTSWTLHSHKHTCAAT